MGFNFLFFGRVDFQDKFTRMNKKSLEMIWRPEQYDKNNKTFMFTHIGYHHYSPPNDFYFDALTMDEPIIEDKKV